MKIIQSKLLNQFIGITHRFTTKKDGNLAFHVGEKRESVLQNHTRLAKSMNYRRDTLVHMKQIHSDIVKEVESGDDFEHPPTCDALITDKKRTPLMVMVADCAPILFYDIKKEVIAVAHAGRAGAFCNIVSNVIESFEHDFSSHRENIFVTVGASIQECCYEVGKEVCKEAESLNFAYAISKTKNKYHLNISKIILKQLLDAGIKKEQIDISKSCTCCCEELFSYRREHTTGRFAGIISLR